MSGSGANRTPLGKINPAIGSGKRSSTGSSLLNPSYLGGFAPSSQNNHSTEKSSRAITDGLESKKSKSDDSSDRSRKRKKKSRWQGSEMEKTFIPGMPTSLPPNMSKEQEEAYLLQLQIEDFSRRLRANDLGIPTNPDDRSPSPEPIYNNEGKRLNTREYRTRKKLEEDRHFAIVKLKDLNPEYKAPADYKAPFIRVFDKVFIPQERFPDINFVGLLIGPRGNTLKMLETETGAKIIIRGKGSIKEGKVAKNNGQPLPGQDEPLHAYISGNNMECIKKAVVRVNEIIKQGVDVPEGMNDLRKMQLRELALLNGTLREVEGVKCSNCGSNQHKSWMCQDKPNLTNSIMCSSCGAAGHIAKDCLMPRPGGVAAAMQGPPVDRQKIDEEYMSLMAELGEGPPPKKGDNQQGPKTMGTAAGSVKSLFDCSVGPPKAIMGAPPGTIGQSGGPNPLLPPPGMNRPPIFNQRGQNINQPPPMTQGFNRPPPVNWQGTQKPGPPNSLLGRPPTSQGNNMMHPPNLLGGLPPPPPPPTSGSTHPGTGQPWMSSAPSPINWPQIGPNQNGNMMPRGPVPVPPPSRPIGPPPGWNWNGPRPGFPNQPPHSQGNHVDLGSLLSAPPPPPPS